MSGRETTASTGACDAEAVCSPKPCVEAAAAAAGADGVSGSVRPDAASSSDEPRKSDLARAFSEDGALKTHVGGQALIEGIMMRGTYNWSVAVREPSGSVYVEEHDLASGRKKNKWMYWPGVRGCRALVESLVLGFKALEIAAEHAFAEEPDDAEAASTGGTAEPAGEACGSGSPARMGSPLGSPARAELASDPSRPFRSTEVEKACSGGGEEARAEGWSSAEDAVALSGAEDGTGGSLAEEGKGFSWKDDFGRPDTMIDALGAQRTLEVVSGPAIADGTAADALNSGRSATVSAAASGSGSSDTAEPEKKSFLDEEVEFGRGAMVASMVMGLVLGVVLFIVAPAFLTNLIVGEYDSNTVLWNVVDGLLRVAVFVLYLWLIGRMADIKRMFGYHGAEHKAIHCYEHGLPLTPENARSFPRLHVRCGTAFLIMVMIIAIFVYTVTPLNALIDAWGVPDGAPKLALVIIVRILLMPVIAGISYEITVKWAGSHPDNPLVKVVLWPGMQMQYLTTNEPDDGMIECAIAAMQRVLEREEAEAAALVAATDESEEAVSAAA